MTHKSSELNALADVDTMPKFAKLLSSKGVENVLAILLQEYNQTIRVEEVEKTKREAIRSDREQRLAIINTQRDFFMEYLNKTFDERKANFAKFFEVVDDALDKNNIEQLSLGLNSISDLAKETPFKILSDVNQLGSFLDSDKEFNL